MCLGGLLLADPSRLDSALHRVEQLENLPVLPLEADIPGQTYDSAQ